nr:cell division cycle-associated 7-like protein [Leptinotarsa decemlineata]
MEFLENASKSEDQIQREKNIQERDAFLASFLDDPEFAEAAEAIGLFQSAVKKKSVRRKPKDVKPKFHDKEHIERRWSLRLQMKEPIFTKDELFDAPTFQKRRYSDYDYEDLEEVVYRPTKKTSAHKKHSDRPPIISVSEVTEEMINRIAKDLSVKKYSNMGTTCHQCRQKTLDQKTSCRNAECIGVRGQFCGICLENRYGEDAIEALKNPNWTCPVCRGICNCSLCRRKEGKRPTGILTPLAHHAGYNSVKAFLDSLKGKGDYINEHEDPNNLLGISMGLKYYQMGGGIKLSFDYQDDHNFYG